MASVQKTKKKERIQVTIFPKDVRETWGEDTSLSLVKHWIELGRDRHKTILESIANIERLEKALEKLSHEMESIAESQLKLTKLLLRTSRLLAHISTSPHYQLELLKVRKRDGHLNEQEAHQHLLAEIKEENFKRYAEREFPGIDTDFFLATTTKQKE